MMRRPPGSTLPATLFPHTTLVRSWMPLDLLPPDATTLFLGLHNGAPRFVAASPAPPELGLRQAIFHVAATLPEGEAAIYACARSLLDWHRRHGFCANCGVPTHVTRGGWARSEEHTSELQSLMRISYAVF